MDSVMPAHNPMMLCHHRLDNENKIGSLLGLWYKVCNREMRPSHQRKPLMKEDRSCPRTNSDLAGDHIDFTGYLLFVRIPHHTPPLIWKTNHHLFQQEPSLVRWPDDGTKYTQYTRSWFPSQREPKPPHKSDLLMLLGSWCKYIWFTNPVHVTL